MREEEKRKRRDGCVARDERSEEVGSHTYIPATALLDDFEKGGEIDQPKWKCGFTCLALITIHRSQAIR